MKLLRHLLVQTPNSPEAHCCLADLLQALERYDEAIEHYELALSLQPENAEPRFRYANVLQKLGRHDAAAAQYAAGLRLRPDHAEMHNNLGIALHTLGELEQAVAHYRAALALKPDSAEAHTNLGSALRALRRPGEAVGHYQTALDIRPDYADAHANLGNIFLDLHNHDQAVACYQAALAITPHHVTALTNLGKALQGLNRPAEALQCYQAALRIAPDNRQVHQGLAIFFLKSGDHVQAKRYGQLGFGNGIEMGRYRGDGAPVRALVLLSALGGAVVTDDWLDDRTFWKTVVTPEFCDPAVDLPPHDVVFNAIGEADLCRFALASAKTLLRRSSAPVVNPPSRVLATGRAANARRLGEIPGVVTPRIAVRPREFLLQAGAAAALARDGFAWPLLLRSPGFHTGEHFLKLDTPGELAASVATLPGDELLVIEYMDVFGPDHKARKYRVMMIDGQLYPVHLAVSARWMVHYLTADMAEHPEHRAEDAAFLFDMHQVLGAGTMKVLARIRDTVGLDYGGIDFSLDRQGRLVVWEANATMVAPLPASDERWSYRREAIERIHGAARTMLLARASAPTSRRCQGVATPGSLTAPHAAVWT